MVTGSLGVHDLGGQDEEPIDTTPRPLQFWEFQTHGLADVCFTKGYWTVDEMRRGIEGLPPAAYRELTYYEKWARSLAVILKERGTITQSELDAALGHDDEEAPAIKFKVGDLVRVRPEKFSARWRKPHLRTPGYIFGVVGTIERECVGRSPDPDQVAFREPVTRQPLYRVRFAQADVWPEYASGSQDTIDIEIHQPWLEAATEEDLGKQQASRAERGLSKRKADHHEHSHAGEHGHGAVDHGDHVHEAREQVEANAVAAEGDTAEKAKLTQALIKVLQGKSLVHPEELRATIEEVETRGQKALGAQLVAKAWMDQAFKARLLRNANAAGAELGIAVAFKTRLLRDANAVGAELGIAVGEPFSKAIAKPAVPKPDEPIVLTAVENTADVHNMVVCTLCSCYPTKLLGTSPHWYRSRSYRARVVREPRAVLKEFGTELPEGVAVHVHDSTADLRYIVVPMRPKGTEGWSEERLRELVTRDSMIGVTLAKSPS